MTRLPVWLNATMQGFDGADGGLAPLARAVENDAGRFGFEDARLLGIGREAEDMHREFTGVDMVAEGVERHVKTASGWPNCLNAWLNALRASGKGLRAFQMMGCRMAMVRSQRVSGESGCTSGVSGFHTVRGVHGMCIERSMPVFTLHVGLLRFM